MKCPKCGMVMRRVGLESLQGTKVFVEMECPACHCRIQAPVSKKP